MTTICNMKKKTGKERVLDLAARKGVLHARDLKKHGLHYEYLGRLCSERLLVRTGRGRYELPDNDITAFHSLAETAQAIPHGVICLLSALRFHNIGTQAPFEVWTAIKRRSRIPDITSPRIRVVVFSGDAFTEGIQKQTIEGISVNVYSPAKTIADGFKYRNKIGIDVALEALKEGMRMNKFTNEELWHSAKVCRVSRIMHPYIEALI